MKMFSNANGKRNPSVLTKHEVHYLIMILPRHRRSTIPVALGEAFYATSIAQRARVADLRIFMRAESPIHGGRCCLVIRHRAGVQPSLFLFVIIPSPMG